MTFCSLLLSLLLFPSMVWSQDLIPELITGDVDIQKGINAAESFARTEVEGKGSQLELRYRSAVPLDTYILPYGRDGSIEHIHAMYVALPAGKSQKVTVDLSISPSWSPGERRYLLFFLSSDETGAAFQSITLRKASVFATLGTGLRHLFSVEPYTPSSYHRLRGYSIFGMPLALLFGLAIVVMAIFFMIRGWRGRGLQQALIICVVGVLIMNARFSLDLLRITGENLTSWYSDAPYGEAGSLHSIAKTIKEEQENDSKAPIRVSLCHYGTSYAPTLLRYLLYPTPLLPQVDGTATHIVIFQAIDWSFEDGMLRCGGVTQQASLLRKFPDGSHVFALSPTQ